MSEKPDERDSMAAKTGAPPEGEVDLSLLEYLLSLTPAQRLEKHFNARLFALRIQQIARQRYGTALDALEADD